MERVRRTFGQYEIIARIGRGGMAEIFLARVRGPAGFQKIVALKCVHPHLSGDEGFREMFLDEAKVSAALDHPAIVQIHGLGEVDGTFFIAMEYVPGQPLHRIIRKLRQAGRRLTPKLALRILAPIAEALGHAHDRRDLKGRPLSIVHRDVSPQNILVGYDGSAKLTDFGIAKAEGRSHGTSGDAVKGKVSYMAPEQVLAEALDARADIFALGIVLYELLTGTSPFRAPNDESMATMRRIVEHDPPPPSRIAPDLPAAIDAIVGKALAKPRDQRYGSSRELAEELQRFAHTLGPAPASELAALMHDLFSEEIKALEDVLRAIDDPSGLVKLPTFGSRPDIPATVALTLPETRVARPSRPPTPELGLPVASLPKVAEAPGADDTIGSHGAWVNYSHPRLERRRTWFWFPLGLGAALLAGGAVFLVSGARFPGTAPERSGHVVSTPIAAPSAPPRQREEPRVPEPQPAPPRLDAVAPQPEPIVIEADLSEEEDADDRSGRRSRRPRASGSPAPAAAAPSAPEEQPAESVAPAVVGGSGRLTIDAVPWAQVYVGGRLLGDTPIFERRLPAGPVSVMLVNPDERLRKTVVIEIPRDGVVRRRVSLR